jgi:hypothetical protein
MGFLMVDGALRLNHVLLAWKQKIADSVIPSFHTRLLDGGEHKSKSQATLMRAKVVEGAFRDRLPKVL